MGSDGGSDGHDNKGYAMHRVALTDSFHLHARNFPSLFKCLEKSNITPTVFLDRENESWGLIQATGNYDALDDRVAPFIARSIRTEAEVFAARDADTLFATEVANLRLWPLCRSEALAYLLTLDNWQTDLMPKDDRAIFDKAWNENREVLALNMAAASYWLNTWYDRRKEIFGHHYCCVFSGSMTYTRTLMELLRRSPTKAIVMESTFTGNDFIFEEMYHPVANNLGVQHPTLRASRREPNMEVPNQYDREVIKARNKVLSASNKNVTQPPVRSLPQFPEDRPQLLLVGQVVNDFSLIEDGFPYVNSIPAYTALIDRLLDETACNIVFKAHPWENKKVHLKSPKTFDALARHVAAMPDARRARVLLVEDVNLQSLIEDSQYFVTFCSQAGIEAAMMGLRPFILGRAFYSGAGFTEDCADIDTLARAVATTPGLLDLAGYKAFDRFLVDLFQYGTTSVFESGEKRIRNMLMRPTPLEQKTPLRTELELGNTQRRSRSTAQRWNGVMRKKSALVHDPEAIRALAPRLEVELIDMPARLSSTAGTIEIAVAVSNTSDFIVPERLAGKPFRLSYHVLTGAGERYLWNGEMTDLPSEVHTDARFTMQFKVPPEPGRFRIIPGMFYPGVCWFDDNREWEIDVA